MDIIWWIIGIVIGYFLIGLVTAKSICDEKNGNVEIWLIIGFWWIVCIGLSVTSFTNWIKK